MKGYVYILSNPAMPGLVKIGRTTRSVESRAVELYQTGVPMPFAIEHWVLSPDCFALERNVHQLLHDQRVGEGREFFRCDKNDAREILDGALLEQLSEMVAEYTESHTLCEHPLAIDSGEAAWIASHTVDVRPYEIAGALRFVAPEELQKAVEIDRRRLQSALDRRLREGATAVVVSIK